jgi:WD40 repeat protein
MLLRSKLIFSFFFFLCLFFLRTTHAQTARRVTETLLSKNGMSEMLDNSYTISNNLRRVAFRIRKGEKMIAVIDTIPGNAYDDVCMPVFSPNGQRFAYTARNGAVRMLVVDNEQIVTMDTSSVITCVLFSADNKNIVYVLTENQKYFLIVNGNKSGPYDYINENSIRFNDNNGGIAYLVKLNDKQFIVYNGKKSGPYDQAGFPVLSTEGNHMAYWVIIDKQLFVILDGKKNKPFDAVGSIIFSEDGKHIFYDVMRNGKQGVVCDTAESEMYVSLHSITTSPDGSRLAYGISLSPGEGEFRDYVVVDGKKAGPYEQVMPTSLIFSPDGKELAYCAQLPLSTIVNGVKVESEDEWFVVQNGKEQKRYHQLQGIPVFSPNSLRMAYAGEKNSKRMINSDGMEGDSFDDIYFMVFSPDSKRMAYSVRLDNKEWVVLDGNNGKAYDDILGQGEIIFDSPDSFHYIAIKGNNIYLVEEKLE